MSEIQEQDSGILSQDELNELLMEVCRSVERDKANEAQKPNQAVQEKKGYFPVSTYEEEIGLDAIFFAEIEETHANLREEESGLSEKERKEKHIVFLEHAQKIMRLQTIARTEGLLSLESAACDEEKNTESVVSEILFLIVDGCDPVMVKRIALLKFFSMEQGAEQALKNIMSIFGLLAIQQGEHPRVVMKLLKNLLPQDVQSDLEDFCEEKRRKAFHETENIEDYCFGDTRIQEHDLGYIETKLCEDVLLSLQTFFLQRVLRELSAYDVYFAMTYFSGECRKRIFQSVSGLWAQDIIQGLVIDDPEDPENYYEHSKWILIQVRSKMIDILACIKKLAENGEIAISAELHARILSVVSSQ